MPLSKFSASDILLRLNHSKDLGEEFVLAEDAEALARQRDQLREALEWAARQLDDAGRSYSSMQVRNALKTTEDE